MDTERFDKITTTLADVRTRRNTLRLLGAAVLGAGGLTFLAEHDADARRKKKKGGRKKGRKDRTPTTDDPQTGNPDMCYEAGDFCQHDEQCCYETTHRMCAVAVNAGNSDKTCCGGTGAYCGAPNEDGDDTHPYCCVGYYCAYNTGSEHGVCQKLPDDDL